MANSENVGSFDAWAGEMHSRLESRLAELGDVGGMDLLSDAGYWKTMCVAAWAENHRHDDAVGEALAERLCCLFRETDPEEDGDEEFVANDELRQRLQDAWKSSSAEVAS